MKSVYRYLLVFILLLLPFVSTGKGQTAVFTYQGRLTDGAIAAHGTYDFRFRLFNGSENPITPNLDITNVSIVNGIFTVELSFGPSLFGGEERFLEVSVKKPAEPEYTLLSPRQRITSTPYSMKSLNSDTSDNALNLDGVPAVEFTQNSDPRLSDTRDPNPGSPNYIQNTATEQPDSKFNISGTGTASFFNATNHYNINGLRVLATPSGTQNTFTGVFAGLANIGNFNSFYGTGAGQSNTSGGGNSFFGTHAGLLNTTGITNSFFGRSAGLSNTTGNGNSFFGTSAGSQTTTGLGNTFFGTTAGSTNITGSNNTLIGGGANVLAGDLSFATAIGSQAVVEASNSIVLGRSNGSDTVVIPGTAKASIFDAGTQYNIMDTRLIGIGGLISGNYTSLMVGTDTGTSTGSLNSFFGHAAGNASTTGSANTLIGHASGISNRTGSYNTYLGHFSGITPRNNTRVTLVGSFSDASDNLDYATAIGASAVVSTSNTIVLGRPNGADKVVVPGLGEGGDLQLCWNANLQISRCVSSLRFKTNVKPFSSGIELVNRLQPITFDWTTNGKGDLGLGAEEVAEIEPLLVTYNDHGQVEGVKYDRIGVVLLNAVQEQQAYIERLEKANRELKARMDKQQDQFDKQKALIEGLMRVVCVQNRAEPVCRPQEEERDQR